MMRLASFLVGVELVMPYVWWENDMPGHKDEDLLSFTDVDTSSALQVRNVSGSNLQPEDGSGPHTSAIAFRGSKNLGT